MFRTLKRAQGIQDINIYTLEKLALLAQALVKKRAIDNPLAFGRRYLPHYFQFTSPQFHQEITTSLLTSTEEGKTDVFAAPRGHAKSTLMTIVYPLWAICTRRKRFIVLVGSTLSLAQQSLMAIKRELEENPLIRKDFGDLAPTRGREEKWTEHEIYTKNRVRVIALGAGGSMRGLRSFEDRPDAIVCDDLEDEESVLSATQRQKLDVWFKNSLMNLEGIKGADVFVIGTVLHFDSLLARLLKQWKGKVYKAIQEDGSALWPEAYPLERLIAKRDGDGEKEGIGTVAFECEYQNNPIDPATQIIKPEWIRYYDDPELMEKDAEGKDVERELTIAQALDPSLGQSARGDFSAFITLGKTRDNFIYVLDAEIERRNVSGQVSACIQGYTKWKGQNGHRGYLCMGVESNGFQAVLKDNIEEKQRGLGLFMPIRAVKNITDKTARIQSLAPLIENGVIRFRKSQTRLITQLLEFPKGDHDDGPDALEMGVRLLRGMVYTGVRVI